MLHNIIDIIEGRMKGKATRGKKWRLKTEAGRRKGRHESAVARQKTEEENRY